jgi:hypothetical protein
LEPDSVGRFDATGRFGVSRGDQLEKRRREQLRRQKQQDKEQRRVKRLAERQTPGVAKDKDADLADMVPGPQPGQIIDLDQ